MMKSYFSRFLHHTLSHSDVNAVSTPSLSHSGLTGVSRSNKVANLFHLDYRVKPDNDSERANYRVKPDNDSVCAGRSMVEMLGVLAIIGVLSVGAIAGYSKAMMKYKLNQYSEAVNLLINNVLQIKGQLQHKANTVTNFRTILYKLKLLPDGIIYDENSEYVHDRWFNNNILITYNNSQYIGSDGKVEQNDMGFIRLNFSPASMHGAEVCHTAINVIKQNAGDIEYMELLQYSDSDGRYNYSGQIRSQELLTLNISKIDQLCNQCRDYEVCGLLVAWK